MIIVYVKFILVIMPLGLFTGELEWIIWLTFNFFHMVENFGV